MRVKRFTAFLLAAMMLLAFAACGGEGDSSVADSSSEDASAVFGELSDTEESASSESSEEESSSSAEESVSLGANVGPWDESEVSVEDYKPLNYEYVKGMWLYQYDSTSLFREDGEQRDEAEYRALVTKICENLERDGYNTLYLQVRGHGDSFYPSALYPPTRYAVADYDSEFIYDPLKIFVETAHKHGISLHAWMNPYRLLLASQIAHVPDSYKIKQWYNEHEGDYVVALEGRYYANPAYEEVQQLVIDGAVEICRNYKVDGIHIDDYFYPSGVKESFDRIAYEALGAGRTLKQFRYDSVNNLVKGLYDAIHAVNPDLLFGISPAGNMSNNRGYLSADIDTWCTTPGYIDYIAPQVYWSHDYVKDFAKFDICSTDWGELVTCDEVKLIIGMGLYRTADPKPSSTDNGWYKHKDNIKRQLEFIYDFESASGYIMFDYETLYDIWTGEYNQDIAEERDNFLPLVKY